MDDEDSNRKCSSTQHGTDINIIKLSYNSPPVSEAVERFKLIRLVFNRLDTRVFCMKNESMNNESMNNESLYERNRWTSLVAFFFG